MSSRAIDIPFFCLIHGFRDPQIARMPFCGDQSIKEIPRCWSRNNVQIPEDNLQFIGTIFTDEIDYKNVSEAEL